MCIPKYKTKEIIYQKNQGGSNYSLITKQWIDETAIICRKKDKLFIYVRRGTETGLLILYILTRVFLSWSNRVRLPYQ